MITITAIINALCAALTDVLGNFTLHSVHRIPNFGPEGTPCGLRIDLYYTMSESNWLARHLCHCEHWIVATESTALQTECNILLTACRTRLQPVTISR
jgi:hypothetical protein